jgi:hypothetical protein
MMVVPFLLGTVITIFFSETPKIFGSFTGALFNGVLTILAVFYVGMGASINFKATPYIVKKGGLYMALMGRSGRPEEGSPDDAVHAGAGTVPAETPRVH